jgi:hypothetical protein
MKIGIKNNCKVAQNGFWCDVARPLRYELYNPLNLKGHEKNNYQQNHHFLHGETSLL